MDLFEYQGKLLYKEFDIKHPNSKLVKNLIEIQESVELSYPIVVKAQVQVGGRGKAGGIKIANNHEELIKYSYEIMGMDIKGHIVEILLLEEASKILEEYYISLTLERSEKKYLIMLSSKGGMDIEKVAEENPEKILSFNIDPTIGFQPFHSRLIANNLNLSGTSFKQAGNFFSQLYKLFTESDASLLEINPLVLTSENSLIALDAKMSFDNNALYRHPKIMALRDETEEDSAEILASKYDLAYIKLDGTIGCLVNGAGLAMATMDIIKLKGSSPANFLDVGGSATKEKVTEAFKIILSDEAVKGILVNIFGGIMRCDIIAEGVVAAAKALSLTKPLVVRLAGTNVEEGKKILSDSGLKITPADDLDDAAMKIVSAVREIN